MADSNELAKSIAASLNMGGEKGRKVAFFLDDEESPTNVREWVSTGSTLLDLAISNRPNGGLPVGKIVEFYGLPGCVHPDTLLPVVLDGRGPEHATKIPADAVEGLLGGGRSVEVMAPGGGYVPVTGYVDKGVRPGVRVRSGAEEIVVGERHLFRTDSGWMMARDIAEDLRAGRTVLVEDASGGLHAVDSVEPVGEVPIVDITVDHPESCYVAHGMVHHNSGKSLIASHVLAHTQDKGGIAVYIDTENAVDPNFLRTIGIDTDKGFIYVQEHRVSKIFDIIEKVIAKVREKDNERFVTVVVDSIAGMTTESEDAGDYEKEGFATDKAIILSRSMRKLTNHLGRERVLLLFTNQVRDNVGCVAPGTEVTFREAP